MFVFTGTYIAHEEEKGRDHRRGGKQSSQGSEPWGEPGRKTRLRPKHGRFPAREDSVREDTDA